MVSASESNDTDVEEAMETFRSNKTEVQKKIFTKWVNSKLKQARVQISDITRDLRDGQKLCTLLELLSASTIKGVSIKRLRALHIQNVNLALEFLRQQKVEFHNVMSENIVDGNEKLTLGLIWCIILKFQIENSMEICGDYSNADGENQKAGKLSLHESLKRWCNTKCGDYGIVVTNFDSSWVDGMAFCAILHKYRPELIDFASLKPEDAMHNLSIAFSAAEKHLGVTSLFDPEDFLTLPDSKCVMTYISMLYTTLEANKSVPQNDTPLHMLVTRSRDNLLQLEKYELSVKTLQEFLRERMKPLENFCYPSSLSGMHNLITETKNFCSSDLTKKYEELMNCRKMYEQIMLAVKVDHQKIEMAPEIHIDQLNQLWVTYETAFRKHQINMSRKMELYLQLENKVYRYNKNVEQRKMWIMETLALLSRNIHEDDLYSLEKLRVKFGLVKQEIDLFKPRVEHLLRVSDELEKVGYFDVASIKYKKFEIIQLWKSLNQIFEAKYKVLLDKIKDVADFKDVSFMRIWKSQMEKQLSEETTATSSVELQTALKMINFVQSNLVEYKKKCEAILESGQVERGGQIIPINVTDPLKSYLFRDYQELVDLAEERKENITRRLSNLHLLSEKTQLEAWLQTAVKKIPDDVSKALIDSVNAALDGHAKSFMLHDIKQFKSIMGNIISEYDRKVEDLSRLIATCERLQEDEQGSEVKDVAKIKEELEQLRRDMTMARDCLSYDVDNLVDLAHLSYDYNQKKQGINEILLSGALWVSSDSNGGDAAKDAEKPNSSTDIQSVINTRSSELSEAMKKLVDYLLANEIELVSVGLKPVDESVEKINVDYQELQDRIARESQQILNMAKLRRIKTEMEAISTWVDDKEHDFNRLNAAKEQAGTSNGSVQFSKQGILACSTEIASLTQDEQAVQKASLKLRELEKELRQIEVPKQEGMEFVENFQPLSFKLNRITENINDRKKHLELVRFVTSQYEESRFLIMSFKEKRNMLDNLAKTPNMSNEEIIILHKLVIDHQKQVGSLWEKILSKEATFKNMQKDSNINLDYVLSEFEQMHELHKYLTQRLAELEKACQDLSDVENFEICFHDMKNWLNTTTCQLEEMEDGGAFEHTPIKVIASTLTEIREELLVRQKEQDNLEELKRKIELTPDKTKIAQYMKSFKNFRSKIKAIENLCSKVHSLLNEYTKFNVIEFSKKYMEVTLLLLENQLDFDCEKMTKTEVEQAMVCIQALINQEQMLENKLKNLSEAFSSTGKFVEKKGVSEMKNALSQMKKRLTAMMKTGRKKYRQLIGVHEFLRLWGLVENYKSSIAYRSDMRKLHQNLESSGSTINLANLCQVSRMEILKIKSALEAAAEELEKIKKRNTINVRNLGVEIENADHLCNKALADITTCMKEESLNSRWDNMSAAPDCESFETKMDMLKNWQNILRHDIDNIGELSHTKPLIQRQCLVQIAAQETSPDTEADSDKTPKPTDVLNTSLMVTEMRDVHEMIDVEYNDITMMGNDPQDLDILSMKEEYLSTQKNLSDMLDTHKKSAKSADAIQGIVALFKSRMNWLDSSKSEISEFCTDTTSKTWSSHVSYLGLHESNITSFYDQYYEQLTEEFNAYANNEEYRELIAPVKNLPTELKSKFESVNGFISDIKLEVNQWMIMYDCTERCEQFLNWLMIHQGFFSFISQYQELSSELCPVDLMSAFMKDLKHLGESELSAIKELVTLAEEMNKTKTPQDDEFVPNDVLERINTMYQHCQDGYNEMLEVSKTMLETLDSNVTAWDLKQILKHYCVWTTSMESSSPDLTLDDVFQGEGSLEAKQLEAHEQLFKLQIDSNTLECLTKAHPQIFDEENNNHNPEIANLMKKFGRRHKIAVNNAEAKLSMIRALELKDCAADFCKFFLERVQKCLTYISEPELNHEGMPSNRNLLLAELTRCTVLYLKPKAEESRALVNQMETMSSNKEFFALYVDFVRYHTQVRTDYDRLFDTCEKLHHTLAKKTRINADKLLLAEMGKVCQLIVNQIRRAPAPTNYYDCVFRCSGFNMLRTMFPGLLKDMKKYSSDLTDLISGEELYKLEIEAVNHTARMRAEWEMSSEILSCEMETAEYMRTAEKSIVKIRALRSLAQTITKDSPTSPVAHCVTYEILTGYRTNYKWVYLKYEDKNITEFLNRRVVNISSKSDALMSKMKKTIRKSNKSMRKNKSVNKKKSLKGTASARKGDLKLSLLDDCRVNFSLVEMKEKSNNPNGPSPKDKNKYSAKQYMLSGLYVLPEDLKALYDARESIVVLKTPARELEINLSALYPEFKLCVFRQATKATPSDIVFTFDLTNCNYEGSSSPTSYAINVTTRQGSIFTLELLTIQQYVIWLAYFEIIKHLTSGRQKPSSATSLASSGAQSS